MPFVWTTTPQPLPPEPEPIPSTAISYKVDVVANTVNAGGSLLYNTSTEQYDVVYPAPNIPDANLTTSTFPLINVSTANITYVSGNTFNAQIANISTANISSISANSANVAALYNPTIITGNVSADPTTPLGIASKQYADSLAGTGTGGVAYVTGQIEYFASLPPTKWLPTQQANVSRTTYANLFNVMGTSHGEGDGSTTFGAPFVPSQTESVDMVYYPRHAISGSDGVIHSPVVKIADGRQMLVMGELVAGSTRDVRYLTVTPSGNILWQLCTPHPDSAGINSMTATRLSDNRILVAGGHTSTFQRSEVYFGTTIANSTVITWDAGTSLPLQRTAHGASLLSDGRVVIAGGIIGTTVQSSVIIGTISGTTITWDTGTSLPQGIQRARQLTLTDGRILYTGGQVQNNQLLPQTYFGTVSGTTITWAEGSSLPHAISNHLMLQLSDGRLFFNGSRDELNSAYFGTISGTTITWTQTTQPDIAVIASSGFQDERGDIWILVGASAVPATMVQHGILVANNEIKWVPQYRSLHTITTLPNNRVICIGGRAEVNAVAHISIGSITGNTITWSSTQSMVDFGTVNPKTGTFGHSTTTLSDGRLLIVGGFNTLNTALPLAYYSNTALANVNVVANTISFVMSNSIPNAINQHGATLLNDSRVLLAGGHNGSTTRNNTWFGSIAGNTISWVGGSALPNTNRNMGFSALPDGRIFMTGGFDGVASRAQTYFGSVNGNTITWTTGTPLPSTLSHHKQITLPDGRICISGGLPNVNTTIARANVLYGYINPGSSQVFWVDDIPLQFGCTEHDMCVTTDGTMIIYGGFAFGNMRGDAHIYTQFPSGVFL